jgi:amidohydrolase
MIAAASGATAAVTITEGYPVTVNDPALSEFLLPVLRRTVGAERVLMAKPGMPSEDFSRFQEKVPGVMFGLGVTPPSIDWRTAPSNHSPLFQGDDAALETGVRLMSNAAMEYLRSGRPRM